jgi:Protein of unknown function (DUF3303)
VGPFAGTPESGTLLLMMFMVIESFKDRKLIGERFERHGRMLPEGVTYHTSWVASAGTRCFQVMEAPDRDSLHGWTCRWDDLIDFEIVPVQVPRTRSSHTDAASPMRTSGSKGALESNPLASLSIPKFASSVLQCMANFGIGTLGRPSL